MDLTPEQQTTAVAAGTLVLGFFLRNVGVVVEWGKVLFVGIKALANVVYRFRASVEKVEDLERDVERLERLLLMLFEKLDLDPEDGEAQLDTVADLKPHEIELVLAWRKMREVPSE